MSGQSDDGQPPPTVHVLRPHHVMLLTIFMLTFKEFETRDLHPLFILHVHRVLLNEVSEVAEPKTRLEVLQELRNGPRADRLECRHLLSSITNVHADIQSADQMTRFFHMLPNLFVEKPQSKDPPVFSRRSLFGYFCRRCFLSFLKLSFTGVVRLQQNYLAWCDGDDTAGYEVIEKEELGEADYLIFKTQADIKSWAQAAPFEAWERGLATGDENLASENLRRYYEQHFHDSNDSGLRHHALLNLVRMHYLQNEFVAARKLLQEAIPVARTSGDTITLQHCVSMLHRLPPMDPGSKPPINEIQPDLNPLEVLFDVKKLMIPENDQPLVASFERILQSLGLYDHNLEWQPLPAESDQWALHAVQAIVWSEAGCQQLSTVEENIVLAFTEVGSDDNNRLTCTLNQAYKRARQGQYDNALCMVLEPLVWREISLTDYVIWANQIWHILFLRASRSGQTRLCKEFLLPNRPPGEFDPKDYFLDVKSQVKSKIRDAFYEVLQLRECGQAMTAIEQLLAGLWHSEFQYRLTMYRTGIILLADVGLEFGLTKRSRRILEEIMPQIINGDELEQRAFACFTLGRCIIAAGGSSPEALREAVPFLLISEADYRTLQIFRSLMDVQYFISVVYHNLGMIVERDEAVERHFSTVEKKAYHEGIAVDEEAKEIWKVVMQVGAALAAR